MPMCSLTKFAFGKWESMVWSIISFQPQQQRRLKQSWEMSYSDGGGSGRSSRKGSRSPKKLRVTKSENSDKTVTSVSYGHHHHHHHHHRSVEGHQPSVHKRNLYIVSFPLILLFNILRTVIYQLYVIFKYIYASTSHLIYRKHSSRNTCQLEIIVDREAVTNRHKSDIEEMAHNARRPPGPGPGDPLLAKQKHHHRRAFEYISKALKIDEENEGRFSKYSCMIYRRKNVC